MLDRLSVQKKLNLLSVVFLIPVFFLTYLLINQSMKDISFGLKEDDGNTYLTTVRQLVVDLSTSYAIPSAPIASSARAGLIEQLKTKATQYDADMNTSDPSREALDSLTKIDGKAADPEDDKSAYREALDKLRTIISRVGDGSNLILDPDLDSFYAMDIVVVRVTDLTNRLDTIKNIVLAQAPRAKLVLDDRAALISAKGQLQSAIDAIDSDLDSGYRGNADGSLKAALEPPHKALSDALTEFMALIEKTQNAETQAERPKLDQFNAAYAKAFQETDRFWEKTASELHRLLSIRVTTLKQTLGMDLGATFVIVLLAFLLLAYIARSIRNAFHGFQVTTTDLAAGTTGITVPFRDRQDEIGKMAEALETLRLNAIEQQRMQANEHAQTSLRLERQTRMEELSRNFDKAVMQMLTRVTDLVENLFVAAEAMSRDAENVEKSGHDVLTLTQSSSQNFQAISAAGEELTSSIQEILRQVQQTVTVTNEANGRVQDTGSRVSELTTSVGKIHEVTKLISEIAEQTNLLALNATIEASRAGEAGRGFTVVANEVKSLANQTARATSDISTQVQAIQSETTYVADAVQSIIQTMGQMKEMTTTVASAVNQQGAATHEITERVDESAKGAQEIVTDIGFVTDAAQQAKTAAKDIFTAVNDLKRENTALRESVESFLSGVRRLDDEDKRSA